MDGEIKMNLLISGGSGLIGKALIQFLLQSQDNYEIVVLSRNPERVTGYPEGVQIAEWDAKTTAGWGNLIDWADAVINLAGASIGGSRLIPNRWTNSRKRLIRDSRTSVGRAITEAILASDRKPEVLIQASAIGYYGFQGDEVLDESSPAGDDFQASVCVDWENSTSEVEKAGIRRVVIRTGLVFAQDGGILERLQLPFHFFVGGKLGSGRQYYSWIHMQDQIRAMAMLLNNSHTSGTYNLTAPNPVRQGELARVLGKTMERPSVIPAPAFALKAALGEVSSLVLEGMRVLPVRLQEAGFEFEYPDLEEALLELVNH
jgi:uncharacterized protein (TIGR01777 family)